MTIFVFVGLEGDGARPGLGSSEQQKQQTVATLCEAMNLQLVT